MNRVLELSVHQLVDLLLRKGSIDNRVYNSSSMLEGSRIHLRYQAMQNGQYLSEVYLERTFVVDDNSVTLSGRADGIIVGSKRVIIDEIKSTVAPLEEYFNEQSEWHLGQAKCYGYMYLLDHDLEEIDIRLTYISQIDEKTMIKEYTFTKERLQKEVEDLIRRYLVIDNMMYDHRMELVKTAEQMRFPYAEFRRGQRELAKYVYSAISSNQNLFIEAPTGIGKTISTLFPAVKALTFNQKGKIFYLAAKSSQKQVAFKTVKTMIDNGLDAKTIIITAKEKMCQNPSGKCNPDECPFAKDYYEKVQAVIFKCFQEQQLIDQNVILYYAENNSICAFELQLDLSLFVDVIICDYNYLFDPIVYLKRYFEESHTDHVILIDEAHNLVDRSKDMYSAEISLHPFELLQRSIRSLKHPKFKRALKKVINYLVSLEEKDFEYYLFEDGPEEQFINLLFNYFKAAQDILKNYPQFVENLFLDVFRAVNRFLKIYDFYDDNFKCFAKKENENLSLVIYCLSSSDLIKKTLAKVRSAVFFSATLAPMKYFIDSLGGDELTPAKRLDSPFPQENLLLLIRPNISTKYQNRQNSYADIASSIKALVIEKVGNYLIFFSSYQYLENVAAFFKNDDDLLILKQHRDMNSKEKEEFLNAFEVSPSITTLGFAVLGGVFSEGIDLFADKLIGAIIIGVGLPQISFERNLIAEYYQEKELDGFDYAYSNPGMNKIMQAAGRVIRSENDRGVVLLIDERYRYQKYHELFKKEWSHYQYVYDEDEIADVVAAFWKKKVE